mmetsp:Transcript_10995/g.19903  ORF Transcript_10995/g.19903 Transcript_10995/m.19903 type:complete len:237 (-) Transcript_10995:93-803(-)
MCAGGMLAGSKVASIAKNFSDFRLKRPFSVINHQSTSAQMPPPPPVISFKKPVTQLPKYILSMPKRPRPKYSMMQSTSLSLQPPAGQCRKAVLGRADLSCGCAKALWEESHSCCCSCICLEELDALFATATWEEPLLSQKLESTDGNEPPSCITLRPRCFPGPGGTITSDVSTTSGKNSAATAAPRVIRPRRCGSTPSPEAVHPCAELKPVACCLRLPRDGVNRAGNPHVACQDAA